MKKGVIIHQLADPIKVGGAETSELAFDFGRIKARHEIEAELWAQNEFGKATNTAVGLAIAAFAGQYVPNDLLELSHDDMKAVAELLVTASKN